MSDGLPYGIIDPDYARVYTVARCIAWSEGYAIMMHGSFTRDLDLLAVPWDEKATEPEHLIRRIVADLEDLNLLIKDPKASSQATKKPHGRLAWTLTFKAFGDPRFIDIGVMPRISSSPNAGDGTQDSGQGGGTPHFDKLAAVLFDGETKLVNFKFTPGTDPNVTSEQRAAEIYASMERAGRIVDGKLQPFGKPGAVVTHPDREGKGGERP